MNIGTHLREARERRGITLRQVADRTKLSTMVLRHIERNELARLPGGIFTKGFLRAYAAAVGEDPEAVVNEYLAQHAPAGGELPAVPAPVLEEPRVGRGLLPIVAIAAAFFGYSWFQESEERPAISTFESAPAPLESRLIGGVLSDALPAAERGGGRLSLDIQPSGECWVSAVADGEPVAYRLLAAGERLTITARAELVLRVGAPDVFAYTLNGEPGRPLGDGRQPVTVTITDENYQTFLADPTGGRRTASAIVS